MVFTCVHRAVHAAARSCRTAVARQHRYAPGGSTPNAIRLYWCEGFRKLTSGSLQRVRDGRGLFAPNFGDSLSPLVVALLTRKAVVYANGPAKLVGLGSIFFALQDNDVVWGAGVLRHEDVQYARIARNVSYRAVRGPLTQQLLRKQGIACSGPCGDPATLLPLFIENDVPVRREIGVVPHWSQYAAFVRDLRDPEVAIIDVCDSFDNVSRAILSCRLVLSTSLHGVILAESYGVPALLVLCGAQSAWDLSKYVDYFQSTGRDLQAFPITRPRDILRLSARALRVPRPRFAREGLLAAFPYPAAQPEGPRLRWSEVRPEQLGCYAPG